MPSEQEYLTKEKFAELEKELETLKTVKRKEIAESLEYAKSLGDLSENQEYQDARDSQAVLEDRINRLENILKHAKIVSSKGTDNVAIGSVVTLEKESDKSNKTYTLVGSEEADISKGKISIHSPLGKALMGRTKGASFVFDAPSGKVSYKVLEVK